MPTINCPNHGKTKLSNWLERKPKPSDKEEHKKKGKVDYVKCRKCFKNIN